MTARVQITTFQRRIKKICGRLEKDKLLLLWADGRRYLGKIFVYFEFDAKTDKMGGMSKVTKVQKQKMFSVNSNLNYVVKK